LGERTSDEKGRKGKSPKALNFPTTMPSKKGVSPVPIGFWDRVQIGLFWTRKKKGNGESLKADIGFPRRTGFWWGYGTPGILKGGSKLG